LTGISVVRDNPVLWAITCTDFPQKVFSGNFSNAKKYFPKNFSIAKNIFRIFSELKKNFLEFFLQSTLEAVA